MSTVCVNINIKVIRQILSTVENATQIIGSIKNHERTLQAR